jgi:hypothetical protein
MPEKSYGQAGMKESGFTSGIQLFVKVVCH